MVSLPEQVDTCLYSHCFRASFGDFGCETPVSGLSSQARSDAATRPITVRDTARAAARRPRCPSISPSLPSTPPRFGRSRLGTGRRRSMTPADFRRLALGLPEASEVGHMGHPDFRVGGKIFATLGYPDG